MAEKRGEWLVHGSEEKFKNGFMTVIEDQVTRPDGQPGTYGRVKVKSGVAVLPVDSDGQVYLLRLFRYAVGRDCIETISGGLDGEEDHLTGAKRELEEEAGMTATEWLYLGVTDPHTSIIDSPVHLYAARGLTTGGEQDQMEKPSLLKVPLAEAVQMVLTNEITHSPSALVVMKYAFTVQGA